MKRTIITTADGSKTIRLEEWNEQYHSVHGALQESMYVFIDQGYRHVLSAHNPGTTQILEIGLGTGLNALLTLIDSDKNSNRVEYVGVEAYPPSLEEIKALNYPELTDVSYSDKFLKLHTSLWEEPIRISEDFVLTKHKMRFSQINFTDRFDLLYFDAFGYRVQPELWSESIFKIMRQALKPKGVLVTYSSKGDVRRILEHLGFYVERLTGPPGKRHMLRATKQIQTRT